MRLLLDTQKEKQVSLNEELETRDEFNDELVSSKVREYITLRERYDDKRKKFNKEIKSLERKVKSLEKELKELAKEYSIREYRCPDGRGIELNPTVRRIINASKFYDFTKKIGAEDVFWKLVSISVTAAVANFGELVLEENGVLEKEVDDFSRISVI